MAQATARYLAIDTSSRRLSIALGNEHKILTVYRSPLAWRHAETLFAALERTLKRAGWRPAQVSGVAVSVGPGSFTGIRIGLAVARTLGQALRIPVVGVSSLETMAQGSLKTPPFGKGRTGGISNPPRSPFSKGGQKKNWIMPEIDALSGKIFTALFESDPEGRLRRVIAETHTTPEEWQRKLKSHRQAVRVTDLPDAAHLLALARPHFRRASPESYKKVLPLYLQRPAAQERRRKK